MATFNFGGGNFYGGYTLQDKDWYKRIPGQAALLRSMRISLFAAIELHEENGSMRHLTEKAPWLRIFPGGGGNQLLADPNKYQLLASRTWSLPYDRKISFFQVRRTDEKLDFNVIVGHLIAGSAKSAQRKTQAAEVVKAYRKLTGPTLCYIDCNSYTMRNGFPQAQLRAAGLVGLRDKSIVPVIRGNYDSHKDTGHDTTRVGRGRWIEDLFTNAGVKVLSGSLYPTGSLSDHNWLGATVNIASPKPLD